MIRFRGLLRFALVIVTYGVFNSAVQHRFGYHEQSSSRPFAIIGALMCMNAIAAYLAFREVKETPLADVRIRTAIVCILVHIFLIAGLQLVLGPMFGASPRGIEEMKQLFSMMHAQGGRSFARLTGPFLSPNLLAAVPGLLMLIHLRYQRGAAISVRFITTFFCVGMTAAILGGARTMFVFYVAGTAAMTWTRSPKHTMLAGMFCAPLLLVVDIPWGQILSIMRLKDLHSLGVRGELWQASLHMMNFNDWMWGFGLTHFPVFCRDHLGYYGSDPHNWILSAAGMFGIFGLLFYGALIRNLLRGMFVFGMKERAICICLFLYFIGREFGNTQYVLNNSPMCCLYWFAISLMFVRRDEATEGSGYFQHEQPVHPAFHADSETA